MKLPNFDYANRRWDVYKQFHCAPYWPFVQMETGELMCVSAHFKPYEPRCLYNVNIIKEGQMTKQIAHLLAWCAFMCFDLVAAFHIGQHVTALLAKAIIHFNGW